MWLTREVLSNFIDYSRSLRTPLKPRSRAAQAFSTSCPDMDEGTTVEAAEQARMAASAKIQSVLRSKGVGRRASTSELILEKRRGAKEKASVLRAAWIRLRSSNRSSTVMTTPACGGRSFLASRRGCTCSILGGRPPTGAAQQDRPREGGVFYIPTVLFVLMMRPMQKGLVSQQPRARA